jgi:oligogalacturonide lyase
MNPSVSPLRALPLFSALALCSLAPAVRAQSADSPPAGAKEPPTSWIDPDTGHRVIRLTKEPNSASFYFNDNGYTADGKEMVYTTPAGISVINLTTFEAHPVVAGPVRAIVTGRKTQTIFYSKKTDRPYYSELWEANVDTGETHKLVDLPRRGDISSINADETIAAGTYLVGDAGLNNGQPARGGTAQAQSLYQSVTKGQMMARRLAARYPEVIYSVDLRTGAIKTLVSSTDWMNHLQFSPKDPTLFLYAHEGAWHQVSRIWTIRTDGSDNRLMHQRVMEMEIAGHEWWAADGSAIWYQLQFPKNVPNSAFLSSVNVTTGERIWYHQDPEASSIHHNISPDGTLFCGDGNRGNPWIVLCRPVRNPDDHTLGADLIKGGYLKSEKLVNMAKTDIHGAHNYRLEPNPSFTPDQKYVVFRSDMFGPTYAFAVEVAKAATP